MPAVQLGYSTGPVVGKRTSTRPPDIRFRAPAPASHPEGEQPFLPIDTPPRTTNRPPSVLRGLGAQVDLAGGSPVPRPFTQYQSENMPLALPSNAGPAAIGTRIGTQQNNYSPASHWAARQQREAWTAAPVVPNPFVGTAKGLRRIRGRVVQFPFASPSWTTITGKPVS